MDGVEGGFEEGVDGEDEEGKAGGECEMFGRGFERARDREGEEEEKHDAVYYSCFGGNVEEDVVGIARLAIVCGGLHFVRIVAESDADKRVFGDDVCRFFPDGEAAARRMIGRIE